MAPAPALAAPAGTESRRAGAPHPPRAVLEPVQAAAARPPAAGLAAERAPRHPAGRLARAPALRPGALGAAPGPGTAAWPPRAGRTLHAPDRCRRAAGTRALRPALAGRTAQRGRAACARHGA